MMADAPKSSRKRRKRPISSVDGSPVAGAPGLDQPAEDGRVGKQISPHAEIAHENAPETPIVQPKLLADEGAVVETPRINQAPDTLPGDIVQPPQEAPNTAESVKSPRWEQLKHIIRQLYIVEDYTLDSVIKIMTEQHAFYSQ
jgi:hypothetical protein